MNLDIISPATTIIFRFYTHCFVFPYEEMNYELQNLFRVLEQNDLSDDELFLADQTLAIINVYQGEEINDLRNEYVSLFTATASGNIICPMIASDFCRMASRPYDPADAEEYILESAIPVDPDEPLDTIVNYLQYFSFACEEYIHGEFNIQVLNSFYHNHMVNWIPQFSDHLYRSAGLSFYKEVATGLKETLLYLNNGQ